VVEVSLATSLNVRYLEILNSIKTVLENTGLFNSVVIGKGKVTSTPIAFVIPNGCRMHLNATGLYTVEAHYTVAIEYSSRDWSTGTEEVTDLVTQVVDEILDILLDSDLCRDPVVERVEIRYPSEPTEDRFEGILSLRVVFEYSG